jgi:prephenate dehydrogenase
MGEVPERILIVGFGLLGASVSLAARARSPRMRVEAVDPDPQARAAAGRLGVDARAACPDRVDHDLVVLCTPFDACPRALGDLAPRLAPPAVVTDVAALKAPLARHATALARSYPSLRYVGAHPVSGSHLRGAIHARADLFAGVPCAVVREAGADAEAEVRVEGFWRALGCRTVWMAAAEHDRHVAATIGLPLVVSAALAGAARRSAGGAETLLAGAGLDDATRLAASPPELWAGFLAAQREEVLATLRLFLQEYERWEKALASGEREAVQRLLEEDRRARVTLFPDALAGEPAPGR